MNTLPANTGSAKNRESVFQRRAFLRTLAVIIMSYHYLSFFFKNEHVGGFH